METIGLVFLIALGMIGLASIAVRLRSGRRAPDAARHEQLRGGQPADPRAQSRVHQTAGSPTWMVIGGGGF